MSRVLWKEGFVLALPMHHTTTTNQPSSTYHISLRKNHTTMSDSEEEFNPSVLFYGVDNAWHEVFLVFKGNTKLTIQFADNDEDHTFIVHDLPCLDALCKRLQNMPDNISDENCRVIKTSQHVFSSIEDKFGHKKYYEALIKKIFINKHTTVDQKEQCMCKFGIEWLAGPDAGRGTLVHIENVHLRQSGTVRSHPVILELAKVLVSKSANKQKPTAMTDSSFDERSAKRIKVGFSDQEKGMQGVKKESQVLEPSKMNTSAAGFSENAHQPLLNTDSIPANSTWNNQLQINNSVLLKRHEDSLGLEKKEIVASSEYKDDLNGTFFNKEGSVSMNVTAPVMSVIENGKEVILIDEDEDDQHNASSGSVKRINIGAVQPKNDRFDQCVTVKIEPGIISSDSVKLPGSVNNSFGVKTESARVISQNDSTCLESHLAHKLRETPLHYDILSTGNDKRVENLSYRSVFAYQTENLTQDRPVNVKENDTAREKHSLMKINHGTLSPSYTILLENLEKDITRADVLDVVCQVTKGPVEVYIIPFFEFEQVTRGYICFKERDDFCRALGKLHHEDLFIVSSNGRPWIASNAKDHLSKDVFGAFRMRTDALQKTNEKSSASKLRVVRKGSMEYAKAQEWKKLFIEWTSDVKTLHRRMEEEESITAIPGSDIRCQNVVDRMMER